MMARKPVKNIYNGSRKYSRKIDENIFGGVRRRRTDIPRVKTKRTVASKVINKTAQRDKKVDKTINKKTVKTNRNNSLALSRSACLGCNPCDTNDRLHRIENLLLIFVILITMIVTIFAQNKIQSITKSLLTVPVVQEQVEQEKHDPRTEIQHDLVEDQEVAVSKNIQQVENQNFEIYCISVFNFLIDNECITINIDCENSNVSDVKDETKQKHKLSEIAISPDNSIKIDIPAGLGNIDGVILGSCEAFSSLFEAVENNDDKKSSKSNAAFLGGDVTFLISPASVKQMHGNNSFSFSQSASVSSTRVVNSHCIPSVGSMAILGVATLFFCNPIRNR